ncbi:hypothetical protein KJ853_04200 [Patescibacteria group bacterium]|nr:hypothetical protein [Patescibacteria group bacterium]
MTCLFPPDLMLYGLGEEIIVEIDGLFAKPERTLEVCHRLAACVGSAIKNLYPKAKVECFITNFYPAQGFWTSAKPTVFICQVFSGCRCNICGGFFADGDEVCASGHQLGRQYAIK